MESCSNNKKKNKETCDLLDMIFKEREWLVNIEQEQRIRSQKKLELKLAPPGSDDDDDDDADADDVNPWMSSSSCNKVADLKQSVVVEKKPFLPNTSQKRTAPAPVVGWPPIRSFRKNLASTSAPSKPQHPTSQTENKTPDEKPGKTISKKSMFVKINMDGIPIGRKVDLNSHDSYRKLSTAVDELFRGLLAVQRDSTAGGIMNKLEDEKPITGVLGGSGEYTLVYEDHEGDRMLVGDVPWNMFVSTVKRLRVLKSSEVSALNRESSKLLAT
ncbi:hypothetical protein ACFE04_003842 [Oxalis oulophora]